MRQQRQRIAHAALTDTHQTQRVRQIGIAGRLTQAVVQGRFSFVLPAVHAVQIGQIDIGWHIIRCDMHGIAVGGFGFQGIATLGIEQTEIDVRFRTVGIGFLRGHILGEYFIHARAHGRRHAGIGRDGQRAGRFDAHNA